MTFMDLQVGDTVFVDANTFTYQLQPHPVFGAMCQQLIQRIERLELVGFTSAHVLSEVAHRLMTLEAFDTFGWPFAGIARRLRNHPAEVQRLTRFRQAVEDVSHSKVQVVPITTSLVVAAAAVSQQTGLLHNDALIVAVMQAHGLTRLASGDADFDRVPGLTRYAPV